MSKMMRYSDKSWGTKILEWFTSKTEVTSAEALQILLSEFGIVSTITAQDKEGYTAELVVHSQDNSDFFKGKYGPQYLEHILSADNHSENPYLFSSIKPLGRYYESFAGVKISLNGSPYFYPNINREEYLKKARTQVGPKFQKPLYFTAIKTIKKMLKNNAEALGIDPQYGIHLGSPSYLDVDDPKILNSALRAIGIDLHITHATSFSDEHKIYAQYDKLAKELGLEHTDAFYDYGFGNRGHRSILYLPNEKISDASLEKVIKATEKYERDLGKTEYQKKGLKEKEKKPVNSHNAPASAAVASAASLPIISSQFPSGNPINKDTKDSQDELDTKHSADNEAETQANVHTAAQPFNPSNSDGGGSTTAQKKKK